MKRSLNNMARYRSSFYCALCDVEFSNFINVGDSTFNINNEFCYDILNDNFAIIQFLHIKFIEYADILFQFTECYEGKADAF